MFRLLCDIEGDVGLQMCIEVLKMFIILKNKVISNRLLHLRHTKLFNRVALYTLDIKLIIHFLLDILSTGFEINKQTLSCFFHFVHINKYIINKHYHSLPSYLFLITRRLSSKKLTLLT